MYAVRRGAEYNPTRLTLARKRRGLSISALAERVGLSRRSIFNYERGRSVPGDHTLATIAQTLGFPITFFFGNDIEELSPDAVSFRAMSKMTAAQRDMALAEGALALLIDSWIDERFKLPPVDLPDLSHETDPETAAIALRRYWGCGEWPIRNMVHLLESKGVRVFSLSVQSREVDAFSMWKDSTPYVFLNTQKSAERSRFDAAHELGHLVLHQHAIGRGRSLEQEANAFASAFLMPRASVLAYARRTYTVATLIQLKKIWGVSVTALAHRLHALGLLSDWQYRRLWMDIAAKRYNVKEPDPAPRETSQVFEKVFRALGEEGITKAHVAADLGIPEEELDQLVFGLVFTQVGGMARVIDSGTRSNKHHLRVVK